MKKIHSQNARTGGGKAIKREVVAVYEKAGERIFNEEGYVLAAVNETNPAIDDGDTKLIHNVAYRTFPENPTDEDSEYHYVNC